MADGNKITVFIPVVCDCGHPIEGAHVKVRILNARSGESRPEFVLHGTTDASGSFFRRFDRGSGKPIDINGGDAEVIVCDRQVEYAELRIDEKLDLGGVFDLMRTVYKTVIGGTVSLDDPEALLGQAQSLAKATSEATFGYFISPSVVTPVGCHGGECAGAKAAHVVNRLTVDDGAARVTFTDEVERDLVPWVGDTRDFTYQVESTGDETLTDVKLCFPAAGDETKAVTAKLDAILKRKVTLPFGWSARRSGTCLVFETGDWLRGIAPGTSKTFRIKADEDAGLGRVRIRTSILEDGEHVDLSDEPGAEIPGPQLIAFTPEEELEPVAETFVLDEAARDRLATLDADRIPTRLEPTPLEPTRLDPTRLEPTPLDGTLLEPVGETTPAGSEPAPDPELLGGALPGDLVKKEVLPSTSEPTPDPAISLQRLDRLARTGDEE